MGEVTQPETTFDGRLFRLVTKQQGQPPFIHNLTSRFFIPSPPARNHCLGRQTSLALLLSPLPQSGATSNSLEGAELRPQARTQNGRNITPSSLGSL